MFILLSLHASPWRHFPPLWARFLCPSTARSLTSCTSSRICNFIVVEITPPGIANIGWKFYIIFALLNAAFVPVIYCFFPETRGIPLEAVDYLFEKQGVTGGVLPRKEARELRRRLRADLERDAHLRDGEAEVVERCEAHVKE